MIRMILTNLFVIESLENILMKKSLKAFNRQNKVVAEGKWRPSGFGAYCKWQPGPDFEYFTDATAAEQHYQNCDATKCKKARFEKSK